MKKKEIIKKLQSGICELKWTDRYSVEHDTIATKATQHLPDGSEQPESNQHTIVAFNVNTEDWETFFVSSIIDIDQLTGKGAVNNEKKLQASSEYLAKLFEGNSGDFDDDDDFNTMEHPEL